MAFAFKGDLTKAINKVITYNELGWHKQIHKQCMVMVRKRTKDKVKFGPD